MHILNKINLNDYFYKTQKSFIFFDILIKNQKINKLDLLSDLKIASSTYRRARQIEQNSGKEIISRLSNYFNLNQIIESNIEIYEEVLSMAYQDVYFGNENNLLKYKQDIESFIKHNNILQPIFEVLLLLINLTNFQKTPSEHINENKKIFERLNSFSAFFTNEIKVILRTIELIINPSSQIDDEIVSLLESVPYAKGLSYYALSTQNLILKNYPMSLHYANECEKALIEDFNINRQIFLRLTKCTCFNVMGKYKQSYECSKKQLILLPSIDGKKKYEVSTLHHYLTACLGLNKNQEVINILENITNKSIQFYLLLMLAYYNKKDIRKVKELYSLFILDDVFDEDINKDLVKYLYNVILKNEQFRINEIEKYNINVGIKLLIKKLKF